MSNLIQNPSTIQVFLRTNSQTALNKRLQKDEPVQFQIWLEVFSMGNSHELQSTQASWISESRNLITIVNERKRKLGRRLLKDWRNMKLSATIESELSKRSNISKNKILVRLHLRQIRKSSLRSGHQNSFTKIKWCILTEF